jgi:hypothetical protein
MAHASAIYYCGRFINLPNKTEKKKDRQKQIQRQRLRGRLRKGGRKLLKITIATRFMLISCLFS